MTIFSRFHFPLFSFHFSYTFSDVSNRELVIDLVSKLPQDTPLGDIARQIELLAGIDLARKQAKRGEGIPAEQVRKLIDSWAPM